MAKRVPFVDRKQELAQIERLISEWDTRRVLCVHGPGGIGKTRLLQEVHKRYAGSREEQSSLLVANIIDFDDRAFHFAGNVGRKIAQMLDKETFEPYLRRLIDRRKMEEAGVSRERLIQEYDAIDREFVNCFNEISARQRVVLLLDTTDALTGTDAWEYMVGLGLKVENTVLIVAGRNAKEIWETLQPQLGEDAQLIELAPLQKKASHLYLRKKQELLQIPLNPDLAQKMLWLASGRPILIDLAVEWRSREIPLDWLMEESLEEIKALPEDEMEKRRRDFERRLVHHVADTRQLMDWLILAMSRVYPLNVKMIANLLGVSLDEAKSLFEEAKTYVFVKALPDGRISLHDEMRRMVNAYVWSEVDPDGDRRRRDSRLAVEYLEREIDDLSKQIDQLEEKEKSAHREGELEEELDIFTKREALERELWRLEGRRLRHLLLVDLDKGVQSFADLFEKATQTYRFSFRETLVTQVQQPQFVKKFSSEQRYAVDIRRTMHLIDDGRYRAAEELLLNMLDREGVLPSQYVEIMIQLGNAEVRLGQFEQAIHHFKEAVERSEANDLEEWLLRSENALGWAYRLVGDWERAAEHYKSALKYSLVQLSVNSFLVSAPVSRPCRSIGSAWLSGHNSQ
jgi:tetratricopeptide (TPR) repeat protein